MAFLQLLSGSFAFDAFVTDFLILSFPDSLSSLWRYLATCAGSTRVISELEAPDAMRDM